MSASERQAHRLRLEAEAERDRWRQLALHALHDLRLTGVPIDKIIGMTPDVLTEVDRYDREMEAFS